MDASAASTSDADRLDTGLRALCGIASYHRLAADPLHLARELALGERPASETDLVRAAALLHLKARIVRKLTVERLASAPAPCLLKMRDGRYNLLVGQTQAGDCRVIDAVTRISRDLAPSALFAEADDLLILVKRTVYGLTIDPKYLGLAWFLPSIWRYRKPLLHVVLASLFIQLFALVTPLFFQIIVDKVLVEKTYSTLVVLVVGLALLGFFETTLQYLRTFALAHTTNRIDVELGQRLFVHLLRLPLGYFETRASGQTVARMRELETIRTFLTGQCLFSVLDLVFALIFIAILLGFSVKLTLVVLVSLPLYVGITVVLRPSLREIIKEKFNRAAVSQQFLVETVVGIGTIKAAAVEPIMRREWEEKLAAYVKTGFQATLKAAVGQNAIQYVSKLNTAAVLLIGAGEVINGDMTIGALIAFNMIAGQVTQPILRLSQLWQDFQQVQISVERLGDILNSPPEPAPRQLTALPPPTGTIEFRDVSFRYNRNTPDILRGIDLTIRSGEVIGIVGPSGSGKSTLTKLVQRLYSPGTGRVLMDGHDLAHVDPAWLRSNVGVVLQDSLLFNRTIHENIALAAPDLPRAHVVRAARLAGAEEFVLKLPHGFDTMIEERGANLSGGQRQRIAIARALATNPPVLILDEATSALDYESERIIQANMQSIASRRTVIIIAHRLAAVRHCHRIIGIRDGQIVESGSHDDLLSRADSLYAHFWRLQTEQIGVPA